MSNSIYDYIARCSLQNKFQEDCVSGVTDNDLPKLKIPDGQTWCIGIHLPAKVSTESTYSRFENIILEGYLEDGKYQLILEGIYLESKAIEVDVIKLVFIDSVGYETVEILSYNQSFYLGSSEYYTLFIFFGSVIAIDFQTAGSHSEGDADDEYIGSSPRILSLDSESLPLPNHIYINQIEVPGNYNGSTLTFFSYILSGVHINYDSNGGSGSQKSGSITWVKDTYGYITGYDMKFPECSFSPPSNQEFKGWKCYTPASSVIWFPGEVRKRSWDTYSFDTWDIYASWEEKDIPPPDPEPDPEPDPGIIEGNPYIEKVESTYKAVNFTLIEDPSADNPYIQKVISNNITTYEFHAKEFREDNQFAIAKDCIYAGEFIENETFLQEDN